MMLPRTHVGNFGVKKISLPDSFYKIFNTKKYNIKICNTNIFRFTVVYQTYCFFGWKYSKYALVNVILKFAIANIKS